MFTNKISLTEAMNRLGQSGREFSVFFEHGTLSVELYKPDFVDKQNPHDRDEVYIIASGRGRFQLESRFTEVSAGDFLFAPAGAEHRFLDFTDDFSTWVLFYGPRGGEQGPVKNHL